MAGKADMVVSITANDMASSALKGLQTNIEQANAKIATQAKSTDALGKNVDKLGYSWGKVAGGLLVAGAGISAVTGFLKDSIQAAAEDELSKAKLAKTLDNLGQSYAKASSEEFIAGLSAQTGEVDDKLRPALEKLVIATGDVAQAQDALVLAQDIAAGTGRELDAVSLALSRGYNGQTAGLSRLGAGIDAATLKSGDMAKITDELNKKFGGQAATAAATFSGEMKRISTATEEASEVVGYSLLGAIESLSSALGGTDGAVGMIARMGDNLAALVTPVTTVSDAFNDFSASTLGLKGNLDFVDAAFQATLNIMGPATAAWQAWGEASAQSKKDTEAAVAGIDTAIAKAKELAVAHGFLKPAINNSTSSWLAYAQAAGEADTEATSLGFATRNLTEDSKKAKSAIESLKGAFDELNGKSRDSISTEADMRSAIDEMRGALEKAAPQLNKTKTGFDLTKESGRKAAEAMNGVASSAESAATAAADEGKWRKAQRLMDDARSALIKQATQWGLTRGEAQKYVDTILAIPSVVRTQAYVQTISQYRPMATGGLVTGPGSGTSDSIPAMLSNGEFVMRASAVDKLGASFLHMLNSGAMQGFAAGGPVGSAVSNIAASVNKAVAGTPTAANLAQIVAQAAATTAQQAQLAQQAAIDAAYQAAVARADAINAQLDWDAQVAADLATQAQAAADQQALLDKMAADIAAEQAAALKAAQAAALELEMKRLAALKDMQTSAVTAAQGMLSAAVQIRNDYAKSVAGSAIAFGSITGYSPAQADGSLNFRPPGSPGAGSAGPSDGGVMGFLSGRLARVRTFGAVIQKLSDMGLNQSTLQEIISAGPDQGTTLGQALIDAGSIGQVNSLATQLQDVSAAIGVGAANAFYGADVNAAQRNLNTVVGASPYAQATPLVIQLQLDGQTVVTQLLALKRTQGGISLGLA